MSLLPTTSCVWNGAWHVPDAKRPLNEMNGPLGAKRFHLKFSLSLSPARWIFFTPLGFLHRGGGFLHEAFPPHPRLLFWLRISCSAIHQQISHLIGLSPLPHAHDTATQTHACSFRAGRTLSSERRLGTAVRWQALEPGGLGLNPASASYLLGNRFNCLRFTVLTCEAGPGTEPTANGCCENQMGYNINMQNNASHAVRTIEVLGITII